MTNPTPLSPAARAVLEAVTWKKYDVPPEGLPAFAEEMAPLIAAALRAAADLLSTEVDAPKTDGMKYAGLWHSYDLLNAIADELENN